MVPASNPYLELTEAFNRGRRRALVSSGQAVVLHRLAIMSKDGDWILREDEEATGHVLNVLAHRGARYRFGAPLDVRWLAGGWSAHFEHWRDGLRLRTDFVTRPPRISTVALEGLWHDADASGRDVVAVEPLVRIKMTMREKDYAVIGELARLLENPRSQLLFSRSSRDLIRLARDRPDALAAAAGVRPGPRARGRGTRGLGGGARSRASSAHASRAMASGGRFCRRRTAPREKRGAIAG